jgi:hypothetical protein
VGTSRLGAPYTLICNIAGQCCDRRGQREQAA